MKNTNEINHGESISVGPGGVAVVGPDGEIRIGKDDDGNWEALIRGCHFVGNMGDKSSAHKALVEEVWDANGWSAK